MTALKDADADFLQSGWSLAATTLGGALKYCATNPAELMLPASTAQSGHAAVVSDVLFTLKYELGEPRPTGLAPGAIAGIAVGSVAAVLVLSLLSLLLFRAYQRRAQQIRNATMPAPAGRGTEHEEFSPISKKASEGVLRPSDSPTAAEWPGSIMEQIVEAPTESEVQRSELPSPPPTNMTDFHVLNDVSEPQELYGSTFLHEHHPAFRADGEQAFLEQSSMHGIDAITAVNDERGSESIDGLRILDLGDDLKAKSSLGLWRLIISRPNHIHTPISHRQSSSSNGSSSSSSIGDSNHHVWTKK